MLILDALIDQHCPKVVEQNLIAKFLACTQRSNLSLSVAHHHLFWVLRYLRFHNGVHPSDLNQQDVETYLSHLATELDYSLATQQKALSSIQYFYLHLLNIEIHPSQFIIRKPRRGFEDHFETKFCLSIISKLAGPSQLMAKLAFYCQLKLREVANLRVSDIDLKSNSISVYNNQGKLKFKTNIPLALHLELRIQKMRANQVSRLIKRTQSNASINNQPTQIGLLKDQSELLFMIAKIEKNQSEQPDNHLVCNTLSRFSANNQLKILKSEILFAVRQTLLASRKINPLLSFAPSHSQHSIAITEVTRIQRKKLLRDNNHQASFLFPNDVSADDSYDLGVA